MKNIDHKRDKSLARRYQGGFFISKKLIIISMIIIAVLVLVVGGYFIVKDTGFQIGNVTAIFKGINIGSGKETPESKAQVDAVASGFDGINLNTLDIDKLVALGKQAVPTLTNMLNSSTASTRYAAVLGLGAIGHNDAGANVLTPLKKALTDSDINVKVASAELVMSFGSKDGIPVLIETLNSTEILKATEPAMPANSYSSLILTRYTDQTFAVDKAAWQTWYDANKDKLKWSKENEKFTV